MTQVGREHGAVGEWYYEDTLDTVDAHSLEGYRRLLGLVQTIAEVLERHDLLIPRTVRFFHPQWSPRELTCNLPAGTSASALAVAVEALLTATRREPPIVPATTEIFGDGSLVQPNGTVVREPDVIWLSATAHGQRAVNVATQVDAWMAHAIDARPQPEVHRRNAPRLVATLEEIRRCTGIEPVTDTSRFAISEPTGLRNQLYDDGEPVDASVLLE